MLPVAEWYTSQLDPDAAGAYDCGPACVNMVLRRFTGQRYSTDALSKQTALRYQWAAVAEGKMQASDMGLPPSALAELLMQYQIDASAQHVSQAGFDALIDDGDLIIALIHYPSIPAKNKQHTFNGAHFIVVYAREGNEYIYADPLWGGARRAEGATQRVSKAALWRAMTVYGKAAQVVAAGGERVVAAATHRVSAPDGLNVRFKPGLGHGIASVLRHNTAVAVTGDAGTVDSIQWSAISLGGSTRYVASNYLAPLGALTGILPRHGVNVDLLNDTANIAPAEFGRLGLVRVELKVADMNPERDNQDLGRAITLYLPWVRENVKLGRRVIIVLTHVTYGQGTGRVWPTMTLDSWREYSTQAASVFGQLAAQLDSPGVIWQIGNEHDIAAETSVYMPPQAYRTHLHLVREALPGKATAITHGHAAGDIGYWRKVVAARSTPLPKLAGVAIHPYTMYAEAKSKYGWNDVKPLVRAYQATTRDLPIWATEFGAQNPDERPQVAGAYAREMYRYFNRHAGAVFFAAGRQDRNFAAYENGKPVRLFWDEALRS